MSQYVPGSENRRGHVSLLSVECARSLSSRCARDQCSSRGDSYGFVGENMSQILGPTFLRLKPFCVKTSNLY